MKRYQKFLVYWLINSLLLYLANMLMPRSVAIGNSIFFKYQAIVFSGFVWSLIIWFTPVFAKELEIAMKDKTTMMLTYLAVNFATLWFIARFSFFTGVGLANYWIVLIIAVAANFVQYMTWKYVEEKK